jgi:glycosyltransferase involved in cell wall biosynthesis
MNRKLEPSVSVVVVVYNMAREAPRTLLSLSAGYQQHIEADDYEVIVVDNGSDPPFDSKEIEHLSGNFRLIRIDPAQPSPAQAINRGIAEARGDIIGVMVDGARMATPGLLHFARHGVSLYDQAVVAALGWYLGYDLQRFSMQSGYDQAREDALLDSIDWPRDGYRLFEISAMDESSADGWFQPVAESNALFMRRELWELLGGFDERFDAPGGGLVNFDTLCRIFEWPEAELVILLGEGTFHQVHGGVSTNAPLDSQIDKWTCWARQYESIRGHSVGIPRPKHPPTYIGTLPRAALVRMMRAAVHPISRYGEQPLGADFNPELWTSASSSRPADETIAGLLDLARNEFRQGRDATACEIARLIRKRAPDLPEPQRLLSLVSPWLPAESSRHNEGADYHLALAKAHHILGDEKAEAASYREALALNPDLREAHLGLARLRMPGDDYLVWLERLYGFLAPEAVIEIGVFYGASLAVLRPPTIAIGVDPTPLVSFPLKTATYIFPETSNAFFAAERPAKLLAGRPLSVGFIDGLHVFEQALSDFMNLERYSGPRSVIMFHDTLPLMEITQRRIRETQFHNGDVWKAILCLKHYRPELDIFTIPTFPGGLTIVTGLQRGSLVLDECYEEAVARFRDVSFSAVERILDSMMNVVSADWDDVESHLKDRLKERRIVAPRPTQTNSRGRLLNRLNPSGKLQREKRPTQI